MNNELDKYLKDNSTNMLNNYNCVFHDISGRNRILTNNGKYPLSECEFKMLLSEVQK